MIIETAALISFGSWLGLKIADKGFESVYKKVTSSDKINKKFYKAVDSVAKEFQDKYPELLGGSIDCFFKQEENFTQLIKLLFLNSKVDIDTISQSFDITTLPDEFILEFVTKLKNELLKDRELNEILANKELYLAIIGITKDIEKIADSTTLSKNEIRKIRKILEEQFEERFSFKNFKSLYSKNALNNLSQISFIGLGLDLSIKKSRMKLQDIFVRLNFKPTSGKYSVAFGRGDLVDPKSSKFRERVIHEDDDSILISYSELFNTGTNIVILGNPGSGKSVLVKSAICAILELKKQEFNTDDLTEYLPFRIELRKYLAYKKEKKKNILKYLTSLLEDEYGISNLLEKNLDNVFKDNKILIFFDGFDEIFKLSDKIEIKNDIENFHNMYPSIRSVVTSRIIGYEEAMLDKNKFCELEILSFNPKQIETYVNNWYSCEESDLQIREREISDFLRKKEKIDQELVTNPLLLSLIVILYRNNLILPDSKLEIYQSCTKTLVDKWDSSKELKIDLDEEVYKRKETIFADLAYWQYQQLSSESITITYDMAKKTVANTLTNKLKIADEFTVDNLAEKFLDYAQKRSLYFDNNFTHKTFLEYYTAYWIYSNIEKKHKSKELDKIISTYCDNPSWFIVLELLFNLIDKDQADTEMIDTLIEKHSANKKSSLPFFINILPSLNNISSQQINRVFSNAILTAIHKVKIPPKRQQPTHYGMGGDGLSQQIFERLQDLGQYKDLNKKFLEAFNGVYHEINTTAKLDKYYLFYLELNLFQSGRISVGLEDEMADIENYRKRVSNNAYLYVLDFSINYSIELEEEKYLQTIEEFIDKFGIDKVFDAYQGYYVNFRLQGFIVQQYFYTQFKSQNIDQLEKNLLHLEGKGLLKKKLIKYLSNNAMFFPEDENDLAATLDSTNVVANKEILAILLLRIYDAFHTPFRAKPDQPVPFKASDYKFGDLFNSIRTIKNRKQGVRKILEELNLLEILGKPRNRKKKRK